MCFQACKTSWTLLFFLSVRKWGKKLVTGKTLLTGKKTLKVLPLTENIDTRYDVSIQCRREVLIRCPSDRFENLHIQFALDIRKHAVFVHVLKKIYYAPRDEIKTRPCFRFHAPLAHLTYDSFCKYCAR